jgi:hypothetical protein
MRVNRLRSMHTPSPWLTTLDWLASAVMAMALRDAAVTQPGWSPPILARVRCVAANVPGHSAGSMPQSHERKAFNGAARASSGKDGQGSGVYEAWINQSRRPAGLSAAVASLPAASRYHQLHQEHRSVGKSRMGEMSNAATWSAGRGRKRSLAEIRYIVIVSYQSVGIGKCSESCHAAPARQAPPKVPQ